MRSNRFRRDAKALEDDEEMWFNEDDDEEGKAVVTPIEKSKTEDDFPDSYEKFMETKKGTKILNFHLELSLLVKQSDSLSLALSTLHTHSLTYTHTQNHNNNK